MLTALLPSCVNKPTYGRADLTQSVKELCRKEYELNVDARLVGKTFYVHTVLDGLVGRDLGLQQETLKKLEGAMLNTTRVALSTDAGLDFLVVKARDSRLGVTVTLLRYMPDIKSLIYMRISRSDFEDRLALETENSLEPEAPDSWRDLTMTEFMARLVASRLQRQFSSNPLVSAFLQVRKVKGAFRDGVLQLRVDKFENEPETNLLIDEILRTAVEETVLDVIKKYGAGQILRRVTVKDDAGRQLIDLETRGLLEKKQASAKPKSLL